MTKIAVGILPLSFCHFRHLYITTHIHGTKEEANNKGTGYKPRTENRTQGPDPREAFPRRLSHQSSGLKTENLA